MYIAHAAEVFRPLLFECVRVGVESCLKRSDGCAGLYSRDRAQPTLIVALRLSADHGREEDVRHSARRRTGERCLHDPADLVNGVVDAKCAPDDGSLPKRRAQ